MKYVKFLVENINKGIRPAHNNKGFVVSNLTLIVMRY